MATYVCSIQYTRGDRQYEAVDVTAESAESAARIGLVELRLLAPGKTPEQHTFHPGRADAHAAVPTMYGEMRVRLA